MRTCRENGSKRLYEVHYKNGFVQHHPWGEDIRELKLPVSKLCHVTHNKQAGEIKAPASGHLYFKPHAKSGKSYNRKQLGESYRYVMDSLPVCELQDIVKCGLEMDTPCYKPISAYEPVFPDFYSWWGPAIDIPLELPGDGTNTPLQLPRDYYKMPKCLPGYLKDPPDSNYGSNAFISTFSDLIYSYARSRGTDTDNIYLKIGGTLRYKLEIGYVIIVCTTDDLGVLGAYAPITHAPSTIFNPNGLIDNHDGEVIDTSAVPVFTTRHIDAWTSYETLNFAFYFRDQSPLVCSVDTIVARKFQHSYCIRKLPLATWYNQYERTFTNKWICPDKITMPDLTKHERVIAFAKSVQGGLAHPCEFP